MKKTSSFLKFLIFLGLSFFISQTAFGKGKLTLYCSVEIDVCEIIEFGLNN